MHQKKEFKVGIRNKIQNYIINPKQLKSWKITKTTQEKTEM